VSAPHAMALVEADIALESAGKLGMGLRPGFAWADVPGGAEGCARAGVLLLMTSPAFVQRLLLLAQTSRWRALLLLMLFSLAVFLPGFFSLPPMDRDEARFAQASRQMLESGDLVDIRFQAEARHKKPVGIYWMQAGTVAAAQALGMADAPRTIWLYRLPSLLGAVLVVLLTYWAGLPLGGPRVAFVGAVLMGSAILLGVEARLAKTDAVLAASIVASMGVLARAWMERDAARPALSLGTAAVFWLALGLGILVKGPIGPAVAGLAILVLVVASRRVDWLFALRPLPGLVLMLLVAAPWFVSITLKTQGAFFAESVGQDMLAKIAEGQESHGAWPGTYLAVLAGTFWPVSPFLFLAIPFIWRARREPAVLFCLAWALPMWLVFELVPTKLPHYVLPLYPALALLVALAGEAGGLVTRGLVARLVTLPLPLPVLLLAAALAALSWYLDQSVPWLGLALLGVAFICALAAWRAYGHALVGTASLAAAAASVFVALGVYGFGVPALRAVQVSGRLAETARGLACPQPLLATAGFREPSLVFLTRTDLLMTDGAGAARFLGEGSCRAAFVERRQEEAFTQAIGQNAPRLLGRVDGININGGRRLDIGVYARDGG
jgi:4-amino-4-deoxy-L-arabinose transferase-like glycosyltransferase